MKIEMKGIYKSFGANGVLKDVGFSLEGGEICALLGENGAGKSTLMNILGGVTRADRGDIFIDGKRTEFLEPVHSLEAGIAFIHQELNLINDLPVYENMFIGREPRKRFGMLDHAHMKKETERILELMDTPLGPDVMVRGLDASYKQIAEIARAIMMNASVIIMDEPTSSLTGLEIERIFAIIKNLAARGVGVVFISHKLREVMQLCTRYTVLRDGNMVASGAVADVTTDDLARFMVGHDVRTEALQREKRVSRGVLRLDNISDSRNFFGVSLEVRSGEVLGVTGLLGDGRGELFLSIFGAGGGYDGQVRIDGHPVKLRSTTQALDYGLAYLPRDRKENGILKDMNILENASIAVWPRISKFGFIMRAAQKSMFGEQVRNLRIKMGGVTDPITSLSGGNQQKVILSRWMMIGPKILILDNPTQGVDVGAKEEIYDIILRLADEGVAVVVLSSEAQEIVRVCDRAAVMYHGRVAGFVEGSAMNEHDIMRLATGAAQQQEV
jgi:ribose transport system ATP-binding protein